MDDNNTPNLEDLGRSLESMNKVFGHLDRVLDDLARKIDYMADVTGSVAQHGDRRSGSSYMPFNMTYDSTSSDILRGKKFNYLRVKKGLDKSVYRAYNERGFEDTLTGVNHDGRKRPAWHIDKSIQCLLTMLKSKKGWSINYG